MGTPSERRFLRTNGHSHLFAGDHGVLYAVVHAPFVLLRDVAVALETLYLSSKSGRVALDREGVDLGHTALPLHSITFSDVKEAIPTLMWKHRHHVQPSLPVHADKAVLQQLCCLCL